LLLPSIADATLIYATRHAGDITPLPLSAICPRAITCHDAVFAEYAFDAGAPRRDACLLASTRALTLFARPTLCYRRCALLPLLANAIFCLPSYFAHLSRHITQHIAVAAAALPLCRYFSSPDAMPLLLPH
jgi:hypothetical protein